MYTNGRQKKIGDVMDYISDPGKLIDKIIDVFGVNFKGIKEIPSKLINGMFKKLKLVRLIL